MSGNSINSAFTQLPNHIELKPLNIKPKTEKISVKVESNTNLLDMLSVSKIISQNPKLYEIKENVFEKSLAIQTTQKKSLIEEGVSAKTQSALSQLGGTSWAGKLASNGGREVAINIPKNFDPSKPTEVIYHFHGHEGTISNVLIGGSGLKDKIEATSKDKNIIVVIPQGPSTKQDHDWMKGTKGEDMNKFENDTLNIIKSKIDPNIKIASISVEGHSAGGLPIANAAREGKLHADKITLMDSSYGDWASSAYANMSKKNPNTKFNVIYIPNSQTSPDALKLKGKPNVTMIEATVNHGSIPKTFFGKF